jgi:hypothetical protein
VLIEASWKLVYCIISGPLYADVHELPSAENRRVCWNTFLIPANAASRLPDQSKHVKEPGVHNRIDPSPQSTSDTMKNTHAGDADYLMLSQRNPGRDS